MPLVKLDIPAGAVRNGTEYQFGVVCFSGRVFVGYLISRLVISTSIRFKVCAALLRALAVGD